MLECMGEKDVCLMRAHGILVVGKTVEEATHKSIVLENLARLNYLAALKGDAPEISDEDKAEFDRRVRVAAASGQSDGERGFGWDYYVSLVNEPGLIQFNELGFAFGH